MMILGLNFYTTSKQTYTSISRILLYEKIDVNSIYKVIDLYAYLDVRQKFRLNLFLTKLFYETPNQNFLWTLHTTNLSSHNPPPPLQAHFSTYSQWGWIQRRVRARFWIRQYQYFKIDFFFAYQLCVVTSCSNFENNCPLIFLR